ncbi:hypothetical protein [Rhodocista pekingensis]|uniref:Uncharacterized protein n=1 Tax=Rhodocista pekingensis TaxID=201185 RepID=A0ABW2KWI3_9PROT
MKRKLHRGPLALSGVFVASALAMPFLGTLPLHLAIAGKIMALIYAAGLLALSFAPVHDRPAGPERRAGSRSRAG